MVQRILQAHNFDSALCVGQEAHNDSLKQSIVQKFFTKE